MRVAINGLGRIGKLLVRALVDHPGEVELVLLNDQTGDPEQHALLLEFDTVHGRWSKAVATQAHALTIEGKTVALTQADQIEDLPLRDLGVDLVIDCTGRFKTTQLVQP